MIVNFINANRNIIKYVIEIEEKNKRFSLDLIILGRGPNKSLNLYQQKYYKRLLKMGLNLIKKILGKALINKNDIRNRLSI